MILVETKTGLWFIEDSGELRAEGTDCLAVAGEETDKEYVLGANMKIHKGTAVALVGYYTEEATINYLKFELNQATNKASLYKVEDGTPTVVNEIDYSVQVGVVYDCQLKFTSTNVICIVNGAIVLNETLPSGYTAGQHGFSHTASTSTYYSSFNLVYFQKEDFYADFTTVINLTKAIPPKDIVGQSGTQQDYYDYLSTTIEQASRFIDGETYGQDGYFQDGGISIIDYFNSVGDAPDYLQLSEEIAAWDSAARTLFLKYRPIISISEVATNSAAIGETDNWSTTNKYRYYEKGVMMLGEGELPAEGYKNIRVTYLVGFSKMPTEIKMACTRLVVNLLQKQISDRTATFVSFQRPTAISFSAPEVLTPDIKMILERYKRLSYGEM